VVGREKSRSAEHSICPRLDRERQNEFKKNTWNKVRKRKKPRLALATAYSALLAAGVV
jgi:hypothetical protein